MLIGLLHHDIKILFKCSCWSTTGLFTRTVSVSVTVKVYHCAYGDGLFDGQNGYRTHSVRQMVRFH